MKAPNASEIKASQELLEFIDSSPTPFHAVQEAALRLEKAGFQHLLEEDA